MYKKKIKMFDSVLQELKSAIFTHEMFLVSSPNTVFMVPLFTFSLALDLEKKNFIWWLIIYRTPTFVSTINISWFVKQCLISKFFAEHVSSFQSDKDDVLGFALYRLISGYKGFSITLSPSARLSHIYSF
jgi:hypothetical protein